MFKILKIYVYVLSSSLGASINENRNVEILEFSQDLSIDEIQGDTIAEIDECSQIDDIPTEFVDQGMDLNIESARLYF